MANELLECFQWSDDEYDPEHVKEELADVLVYCRNMLDVLGLDEDEIVNRKMDQNERKYPMEKFFWQENAKENGDGRGLQERRKPVHGVAGR